MLSVLARARWLVLVLTLMEQVVASDVKQQSLETRIYHGENSNEDCALFIHGAGRSNRADYTRSLLLGRRNGHYESGTCITYHSVNSALAQALKHLRVESPEEEWTPEILATVGEVFLEVTRILAYQYGLSGYEIETKLPLIDTLKTDLLHYCPDYLAPLYCTPGKYRRFDGLCNNLKHPTWGARLTPFTRAIPPAYEDGVSEPRSGYDGYPLPSPRAVTAVVHTEENFIDHAATTLVVSWGQFMDHDFTLTGTLLNPLDRNEFEDCCFPPNGERPNEYCFNIDVPADDVFFSRFGVRCIDFVRGFPGVNHGCKLGSRPQFNLLTSTIDANTVYGVRESFARSLRTGEGGRLRTNPAHSHLGLMDLLPPKTDIPDEGCSHREENNNQFCFEGGEIRVSEQLILTCMHTLWVREHNRITYHLAAINPHWTDEIIYQETRAIVIAMIQHITFNEFLPVLMSEDVLSKFNLLLQKEGYWNGYDESVNPGILNSFAAAAFRVGHTLLPTNVMRYSPAHRFISQIPLSQTIRQPFPLYEPGALDEFFLGMTNQPALAVDDFVTAEVTTLLFAKPGNRFGVDLTAFNLQRNREVGLPGYTAYRKFCGLPPVERFEDLLGSMSNETVRRFASVLRSPHDIDLWSGGVSERALPGSLLGPTFSCIIALQFSNARSGDRFWYESGDQPSSFSIDQLQEIRKARLSRVLCDNTDLIETIQLYPFFLPDHEINPRVSCKSSIIPHVDLGKWSEHRNAREKTPTLVEPIPYENIRKHHTLDKNGITVNEGALNRLREALTHGIYRNAFIGPHRAPLYPYSGRKPSPTRRPITLSQEYIDNLNSQLLHGGYPSLSGLYSFLSDTPNYLREKRHYNSNQFFGQYAPYEPRHAAKYRTETDDIVQNAIINAMQIQEKFNANKFNPIQGDYGNFTLPEFIHLAERLVQDTSSLSTTSSVLVTEAPTRPTVRSTSKSKKFPSNRSKNVKISPSGKNGNQHKGNSKRRYKRKV